MNRFIQISAIVLLLVFISVACIPGYLLCALGARPMEEILEKRGIKVKKWTLILSPNKRDIKDWMQLCPSCHRIYDKYLLTFEQLYERTAN